MVRQRHYFRETNTGKRVFIRDLTVYNNKRVLFAERALTHSFPEKFYNFHGSLSLSTSDSKKR